MINVPRAALEVYEIGPVLADPVPRVHSPVLTAGASASHTAVNRPMKKSPLCASQRSHSRPRAPKLCAAPPPPTGRRRRTRQPVSASTARGRTGVSAMGVTFSVVHGCQGLPDRAPCMQGGRWCVASKHTPQLPPDGSDLPRELMPFVMLKCAPASARSRCALVGVHGGHVGISVTYSNTRARLLGILLSCVQ